MTQTQQQIQELARRELSLPLGELAAIMVNIKLEGQKVTEEEWGQLWDRYVLDLASKPARYAGRPNLRQGHR